jgi:GNAT superfamily N-acetyltransferase
MLTRRDDGYEIDTDPARLDLDRVHEWLATDAYWAVGRTMDVTTRSVEASLCLGIYAPDGAQVAFTRAVTDMATFAWLCDVYVAKPYRGKGLGTWMVDVARQTLLDLGVPRIVLATADAHGVYAKAGFIPLAEPHRWMEIDFRPGGLPQPPPRTGTEGSE